MEWRPAGDGDAGMLADLALGSANASDIEQVRSFLSSWRVLNKYFSVILFALRAI